MILFLAGHSAGQIDAAAGERALEALVASLPFFPERPMEGWRSPSGTMAAAWVQHPSEQTGGVRHIAASSERLALFCGRPLAWSGTEEADGRGALDPSGYLGDVAAWQRRLDGRCAVVRCDDAERMLEVWTDALGAYPLYAVRAGGATWFSNNPELLRSLHGGRDLDLTALAGLLGGGWPLDGHPVWSAVRRIDRGAVVRVGPDGTTRGAARLPTEEIVSMIGAGLDPRAAARTLVAAMRGLADWPGRPSVVPVTGGRDSRLVLASALRAGVDFTAATGGAPADPDVARARELCRTAGIAHRLLPADPHGDAFSAPETAARLLAATAGGTASLADAAGFPMGPRDGALELWHSGQGGEIARGYYGAAAADAPALAEHLYRRFAGRRPGRVEPLSQRGSALVVGQLRAWVDEQLAAGAHPSDVPDLFYLLRRMGTWAGPTHGAVEYVRDTTSPLWSWRMLPHLLGLPAEQRAAERFHLEALRELAPELVGLPFADGFTWRPPPSPVAARARRARRLALRGLVELGRRLRPSGRGARPDPFMAVHATTADAVRAAPDHPAWEVLDRARMDALLDRPAATLDTMSRYYVWRLATVFLGLQLR